MKLRVEEDTTRKISFEPCQQGPHLPESVVLAFNVEPQLKENWCWAAISSSIGRYYQTGHWQQQQLAYDVLKAKHGPTAAPGDNHPCTLDHGLSHVGCLGNWSQGKPSFEQLQYAINDERPVCLRLAWFSGGAHYLVIKGYNPRTLELYIDDPRYGTSISRYGDFPFGYKKVGGLWSETFWTGRGAGALQ